MDDKYSEATLREQYNDYKNSYVKREQLKTNGVPIRHQNPPEDITENISKFIIRNYDNDPTCMWCKGVNKKGDLYSDKYDTIEIKSFTSNGPSQFGPKKKFSILYFLDLRKWLENNIVLWRVNLQDDSNEFKNVKMNKTQTHSEQCEEGRRPHISWDKLYPQIKDFCVKIYDGSFEDIFVNLDSSV